MRSSGRLNSHATIGGIAPPLKLDVRWREPMAPPPILMTPSRHPGTLVEPFAFDPAQFMMWRPETGNYILQIEMPRGPKYEVDLSGDVAAQLHESLLTLRNNDLKGVWILGRWPRVLRFTFRGLTSGPYPVIRLSITWIQVLPVGVQSGHVRPVSFDNFCARLATVLPN